MSIHIAMKFTARKSFISVNILHRPVTVFRGFAVLLLCLLSTFARANTAAVISFSDNLLIVNGKVITGSNVEGIGVKGNGKLREELREMAPFEEIKIELAADINYRRGNRHEIKIHAEGNLLPLIKSEINKGQLRIYASESFQSSKAIEIEIASAHLTRFIHQGSGDVKIRDVNEPGFSLNVEGQSDLSIAGTTQQFALRFSGSGDLDAKNFRAANCEFSLLGSSDISAYCIESVEGSLMGAGDIEIYGEPKKRALKAIGAGDIEYR